MTGEDLKVEIKGREIVIKKLDTAIRALQKTITRIKANREERKKKVLEYASEDNWQRLLVTEIFLKLSIMHFLMP